MFQTFVSEVCSLNENLKKSLKLDLNSRYFLIYGERITENANLKVNEYLVEERSDSSYYKVVRFPSIRKIPYKKNYLHIVIKPVSNNLAHITSENICKRLDNIKLVQTIDYEKIVACSIEYNCYSLKEKKFEIIFQNTRKIIDDFDPLSLGCAPIDEYDDLTRKITGFYFKKISANEFKQLARQSIVEYIDMELKSLDSVDIVIAKLLDLHKAHLNFG